MCANFLFSAQIFLKMFHLIHPKIHICMYISVVLPKTADIDPLHIQVFQFTPNQFQVDPLRTGQLTY